MKKRSARDIPDFSRKGPPAKNVANPQPSAKPPARGNPPPVIKPQSTSAKSGRRGQ